VLQVAVAANLCEEKKIVASSAAVWYPTIFPDKCDGCEDLEKPYCIEFCPHGVFALKDGKALVVNPHKCIYGCIACERLCPSKAIAFPQRIATMQKFKKIRGCCERLNVGTAAKVFWDQPRHRLMLRLRKVILKVDAHA